MRPPVIILHEPQLGENIGAAARVMGNFGLTELRLVSPRDGWPNPAADTMSAGAFEAGGVAVGVFGTLEAALAGVSYVLATTARPRGMQKPVMGPREAAVMVQRIGLQGGGARVGILFGAEKSGLPNEAVTLADAILTYPVNPAFSSLNLAQAVCVMAQAWGEIALGQPEYAAGDAMEPAASREELVGMLEHFEAELERAGFFFPPEKTPMMIQNLRNAFTRAGWSAQEVRTFRGAIKALAIGRGKARTERE